MPLAYEIILYLYAFIPGLVVATLLWWMDEQKRPSWLLGLLSFLWGAVIAFLLFSQLETLFTLLQFQRTGKTSDQIIRYVLFTPLLEEALKGLAILALWRLKKVKRMSDGIVIGLFVGFGFAAMENWIYAKQSFQSSGILAMWYQLWFRSIHTSLLHGTASAVWGGFLGFCLEKQQLKKRVFIPLGLILASVTHALWNLLGLYSNPAVQPHKTLSIIMQAEVFVSFGLLVLFFLYGVKANQTKLLRKVLSKGVLIFTIALVLMFSSYSYFIRKQVESSDEYETAVKFVKTSKDLHESAEIDLKDLHFKGLQITLKNNVGQSQIQFASQDNEIHVGLVRIADYWIVYDVTLHKPSGAFPVTGTYELILNYLIDWSLKDIESAATSYEMAVQEIHNSHLREYLAAKQAALLDNLDKAQIAFEKNLKKAQESRAAILYDRAFLFFNAEQYAEALKVLSPLVTELSGKQSENPADLEPGLFQNLPKDPLVANYDHQNILAKSYKLMALCHYNIDDFENGVLMAEQALTQAENINSSVLSQSALYIKGLNLHAAEDYKLAEEVFDEVIMDIDNPNLEQKSWAYFFKSDIARRENRQQEALDYLEFAINLEPKNSNIRKEAIGYLIERNYTGDLEIALGLALRGIDYGVERELFKDLSSQLYQRLEMPDKTWSLE